jgi:hypothetical protein
MEQLYAQRRFMILNASDLYLVNFSEVCESSAETTRKSMDGARAILKWNGTATPSSIAALSNTTGPLVYSEAIALMQTPAWSPPQEDL